MTAVDRWLADAVADLRARGIEGGVPVVEAIARAMQALREADWNDDAARPGSRAGGRDR